MKKEFMRTLLCPLVEKSLLLWKHPYLLRYPHSKRGRILLCIASLFLCICSVSLLLQLLDPPLRLTGRPVSEILSENSGKVQPDVYFNANARFVFFNNWYGQFNNQLVGLVNAVFIARGIGAVLVLPCEKLGKESIRDSRFIKMRRLFSTRELVGSYFNYTKFSSAAAVVSPSDFLRSVDGKELLARKQVVVERKSGGFYRFTLEGHRRGRDAIAEGADMPGVDATAHVRVYSPESPRRRLSGFCDFRAENALTRAQRRHADRFVLLPNVFRRHNINCSLEHPGWVEIRKHLVPRDEFVWAVDAFMKKLEAPILAIHLRFFLNGDMRNFTPESFVSMLYDIFGEQMRRARTIFLAYTPSSGESVQILEMLHERFHGHVVSGETIPRLFKEEDQWILQLPLHNVLLDMWTCVKSDMFLGRIGSSLSWNVAYWRQALAEEYQLKALDVNEPLWYSLQNFSSTGASRAEGAPFGIH